MFGTIRRYREWLKQAEADADDLIARFGDTAYYEAGERLLLARRGVVVDSNRSAGHWDGVRVIIGRKTGHDTLDTSTRYLDGG